MLSPPTKQIVSIYPDASLGGVYVAPRPDYPVCCIFNAPATPPRLELLLSIDPVAD